MAILKLIQKEFFNYFWVTIFPMILFVWSGMLYMDLNGKFSNSMLSFRQLVTFLILGLALDIIFGMSFSKDAFTSLLKFYKVIFFKGEIKL